jgi:hypothetical protein
MDETGYCLDILIDCGVISSFFLGLIGNVWSFKTYQSSAFDKSSFALYFKVMSLNNLAITLYSLVFLLTVVFHIDLHNQTNFFCQVDIYFSTFLASISNYLLVFITLDRFVRISFPARFKFLDKIEFQITLIFIDYVFNILYPMGYIWNKKFNITVQNGSLFTNDSSSSIVVNTECIELAGVHKIDLMVLINSVIVPFALLLLFSLATILGVFRSRIRMAQGGASNALSRRDIKFAVTSIVLNVTFLALNLPQKIYFNVNNSRMNTQTMEVTILLNNFLGLLVNFYYASDFFVQLATNSIFREEFLKVLDLKYLEENKTPKG